MNQNEIFGKAIWVSADVKKCEDILFLRGKFTVNGTAKATLRVLGLGVFHCFINGKRVGDDLFLPLNSDFEARESFPRGEILNGHRIYVPEYDVTPYLRNGENTVVIHFGGGWYTANTYTKKFGEPKAIWRIFGTDADGSFDFCSSTSDRVAKSYVYGYDFTRWEKHDYRISSADATSPDFDDSAWDNAIPAKPLDTEYLFSDCPADGVCEVLGAIKIKNGDGFAVYDTGKNTSGYPVLRLTGAIGDTVRVAFSEELDESGMPDATYGHGQCAEFICNGNERTARPLFTWFGFRYFTVYGNATLESVEVVHSKVCVTASFECDNELINRIHDTFINTQLTNMHSGIPSDCPHFERRGYTGDGQLVCHTAMNVLDARAFYRKWIYDILDCQDTLTGHVQYTAPYVRSGGGPGGWGCAIVEVPYEYYRQYGDTELLKDAYPQMLRYFDYLEAHSENALVISDKEGEWCLGDWCPPTDVILPAPFVNNYFYIKSLYRAIEIAEILGYGCDIPRFEAKISERKQAIMSAYFNKWDGNFLGGVQGANAFALDIGLGDERTYPNLVKRYEKIGYYDTGIFGTDILTKILFERGNGDLAVKLLTSTHTHSFAEMLRRGATTLWEYWPESLEDRSHNHPMFGAVVGHLYDYLLGIKSTPSKLLISPVITQTLNFVSGHRTLSSGTVSVKCEKKAGKLLLDVAVPTDATLRLFGKEFPLSMGEHKLQFEI